MTLNTEQLHQIEQIIREAGSMMLDAHLKKSDISNKEGDANFVTVYDKAIQDFLIGRFHLLIPDAGFYGEEDTEGNNRSTEGCVFIIDPIDGTTNFLFDRKDSCVSVGFACDQEMVAGWVYKPYTDEMWYAQRGKGSYLNGRKLILEDLGMEEGLVTFGVVRYNAQFVDLTFDIMKECFWQSVGIRESGSAAIDLCRAASGSTAIFFEFLLQPYDYAAASIIIEEAGGVISRIDGSKLRIDIPGSAVGGSPKAVAQLIEMARKRDYTEK